jgi:sporulation protein YlmC with PRC-barrel domain
MRIFTPAIAVLALVMTSGAMAQQPSTGRAEPLSSAPGNSFTMTNYYKQNVYDKADQRIGQIADVLITEDGKITAFVIGAGGFLGMGKHDVLVPFSAVSTTKKDGKPHLVMDTSKDALKSARTARTWVREDRATEGSRPAGDKRSKKQ